MIICKLTTKVAILPIKIAVVMIYENFARYFNIVNDLHLKVACNRVTIIYM